VADSPRGNVKRRENLSEEADDRGQYRDRMFSAPVSDPKTPYG
jgi:hypothetical protein